MPFLVLVFADLLSGEAGRFTGSLEGHVVFLSLNIPGPPVRRRTLRVLSVEARDEVVLRPGEVRAVRLGAHCLTVLRPPGLDAEELALSGIPDGLLNDWCRAGAARGRA